MKHNRTHLLLALILAFPAFGDSDQDKQDREMDKQRQEMKLEKEKQEAELEKQKKEAETESEKKKREAELDAEKSKRTNPYRMQMGLQGGLAISSASIESGTTSSSRVGFSLGALVEAPLLPGFLYFQPEINFLQKGAENGHFGSLATAKMNYLEVPLLAKVKFSLPKFRPFFVGGPSMAYLLSSSLEGAGVAANQERFNKIEYNLILGGGVCFLVGDSLDATEVTVSARYSRALNDAASIGGKWRSDAFAVLLGIQI